MTHRTLRRRVGTTDRRRLDDRGSITVEVALGTVVVLGIVGFVFLAGRLGGAGADVGQAARDAARIGSLYAPGRAQPEAQQAALGALDGSSTNCVDLTVDLVSTGEPGTLATATVTCTVQISEFPIIGATTKPVTRTSSHPIDLWRAQP